MNRNIFFLIFQLLFHFIKKKEKCWYLKIREEILIWMTLLQYFGKSSFHYQAISLKIQKEIKLRLDRF
jgi:hypothetical protein